MLAHPYSPVVLAPLSVFAGRSFMPDMAYLAFSIAGLYLFTIWLEDEKSLLRLAMACAATTLAILVKLPAIIIAFAMLYMAWTKYGATRRANENCGRLPLAHSSCR